MEKFVLLYKITKQWLIALYILLKCVFKDPSKVLDIDVGMKVYGGAITKSSLKFLHKFSRDEQAQILFNRGKCLLAERLCDKEYLETLPENTLGKHYYNLVYRNNAGELKHNYMDLFRNAKKDGEYKKIRNDNTDKYDQVKKNIAMTERTYPEILAQHDLMHTICGVDTSAEGELYLHAFLSNQIKIPATRLVAIAIGLYFIVNKFNFKVVRNSFKYYDAGKNSKWLLPIDWANLLDRDIYELRRELNINL